MLAPASPISRPIRAPIRPDLDPRAVERNGDAELVVLLDALQQNWTELGYRQELAAYHGAGRWRSARTVLDANAGNGRYLSEIARRFPEKRYFGAESNPAMLERAAIRYASQGIELRCLALEAVDGSYDAVILRSLPGAAARTRSTLDTIAGLTNVGGSAFVIELLDHQRYFEPTPRRVVDFLAAHGEARGAAAGIGIDQSLGSLARSHPAWFPSVTLDVVLPSTVGDNLSLFEETYALTFELAERTSPLATDYGALREEWRWWCRQSNRYTQAALRVLRLDRI